jgi:hypothetical protein
MVATFLGTSTSPLGRSHANFAVEVQAAPVQNVINHVMLSVGNGPLATWMERDVVPYFQEQIVDRFAYNGGSDMNWYPLQESTKRIRQAMGQTDDDAINDRTGAMLETLASQYEINQAAGSAEMMIPGRSVDDLTREKIMTAQMGKSEPNPLFGGAVSITPPRPVLVINDEDSKAVMLMLQTHIVNFVSGVLSLGSVS